MEGHPDKPTPVLIFFHGGGFLGGNKSNLDANLLDQCIKAGISVASSNYCLSTQAPFPAPMLDGARAVQFLRAIAATWNLDPAKIAAAGGSAGAGMSLWIGFHDDLADPSSPDPVLRQSSRLCCMGVFGAQCSYDLRFIKEQIGGRAYEHVAFPSFYGLKPEEFDTPRAYKAFEEASAINYATADDPPVFMYYTDPEDPLPPGPHPGPGIYYPGFGQIAKGQPRPGTGIHHPKFGRILKAKLDTLNIECVVRHQKEYAQSPNPAQAANRELVEFLSRHFADSSKKVLR